MKKKYEQKQEACQFVFPPETIHTQAMLTKVPIFKPVHLPKLES